MTPRISVLIATYRRPEDLRRCVASVLATPEMDIEVLVSDNASPDHTQEVLASFSDPRLRYWRNDHNVGAEENFKLICNEAVGEWCFWLTDDDYLLPEGLSPIFETIRANPGIGVILSAIENFLPDGSGFPATYAKPESAYLQAGHEALCELLWQSHILSRICFRREWVDWLKLFAFVHTQYPQIHLVGQVLKLHPGYYLCQPVVAHAVGNEIHWSYEDDLMTSGKVKILNALLGSPEWSQTRDQLLERLTRELGGAPMKHLWQSGRFWAFQRALLRTPDVFWSRAYVRVMVRFFVSMVAAPFRPVLRKFRPLAQDQADA